MITLYLSLATHVVVIGECYSGFRQRCCGDKLGGDKDIVVLIALPPLKKRKKEKELKRRKGSIEGGRGGGGLSRGEMEVLLPKSFH